MGLSKLFNLGVKFERSSVVDFLQSKVKRHKHLSTAENGNCGECFEFQVILKFLEKYNDAHNCGCHFCEEMDYEEKCSSCVEACLPCQDQFDEPE